MSKGEQRISDTQGRFAQPVRNGNPLNDASWTSGRILLSNKRVILAGGSGKRTLPLDQVTNIGGRFDVNQTIASVSGYTSLELDDDVILIATDQPDQFERDLFSALLNQTIVLLRHPAVKGGVVQDTDWEKARIKLTEESVDVATAEGEFVTFDLDDIGSLEAGERTVMDARRRVVEVEHTVEGTSVQSYFSGPDRKTAFLQELFEQAAGRNEADLDLEERDKEVLMALYSGVSPFEIPDFTGMEVDTVEETFERLIEVDVLDEVRKRREVTLTTRGRNMASEAISDK